MQPVAPGQRIVEVDIVRGFALFGVLLVNMYSFGADSIAWNGGADRAARTLMHLLFDSKFWTLFSLLFGFGLALQLQKFSHRPSLATALMLLRRLLFLFVIGMGHALFYEGDILMLYAETGLILLFIHRLPKRWLVILALSLLMVFPIAHWLQPGRDAEPAPTSVIEAQQELLLERETSVYATGSLQDIFAYHAEVIPENPLAEYLWPDSGLAVLALFIFGLLVGRTNILRDVPAHAASIAKARALGLSVGILAMGAEWALSIFTGYDLYHPSGDNRAVQCIGDLLFVLGSVSLATGYAASLILWAQKPLGRTLLLPLASAGRLALSVYLTQSLIFTTLFHGYGLGLAYRLGPLAVTVAAILIFSVQVMLSHWWLRHFRFGPFEWLWRSFTYLHWQALKRNSV
jgi:uncharacterized protein